MALMCTSGLTLLPANDNATEELVLRLRQFKLGFEIYHAYLCAFICAFGIVTNLINVVVLTKRQMRTSVNVLLTGIAVCDMGTMISYAVFLKNFAFADGYCNPAVKTWYWMFFLLCHIMVSVALHSAGLWLAVAMAFLRNMTLRQARLGSPWLRVNGAWKLCLLVYACVFLLCLPSAFSYQIVVDDTYYNNTCNENVSPEQLVRLARDHVPYTIDVPQGNCLHFNVSFWMSGILFKLVPCLLLAWLISSLLCTIKRAERHRKALLDVNRNRGRQPNQQSARSDRTTTMLVVILVLFLLTELPQGAVSILSGIFSDVQLLIYPAVADILDLLSLINSSVNFVLYCGMSSKYRQVFWQVVLPRRLYIRFFVRQQRSNRQRLRTAQRYRAAFPDGADRQLAGGDATAAAGAATVDADANSQTLSGMMDEEMGWSIGNNSLVKPGTVTESRNLTTGLGSAGSPPPVGNFRQNIFAFPGDLRKKAVLTAARANHVAPPQSDAPSTVLPIFGRRSTFARSFLVSGMKRNSRLTVTPETVTGTQQQHQQPLQQPPLTSTCGKFKRGRWLIACSCLCKCACKTNADSALVAPTTTAAAAAVGSAAAAVANSSTTTTMAAALASAPDTQLIDAETDDDDRCCYANEPVDSDLLNPQTAVVTQRRFSVEETVFL